MDEPLYRLLKRLALGLAAAWIAWSLYDGLIAEPVPHQKDRAAAVRLLEDGRYAEALATYDDILVEDPGDLAARRGRAQALLLLGRLAEARAEYDRVIEREEARGVGEENRARLGVTYANRGIVEDRMGAYEAAMADYEKAMKLEPEVTEGPGWLTRFLRNQPEVPPTVKDRLEYLRRQFRLPEDQRVLRIPEKDARQRPYKL